MREPLLQLALGLRDVDAAAISAWSEQIGAAAAESFLTSLIRGLRVSGRCSGAITLAAASDFVLAVNSTRGHWVGRAAADPSSINGLTSSLATAFDRHATFSAANAWIEACFTARDGHILPKRRRTKASCSGSRSRSTMPGRPAVLARTARARRRTFSPRDTLARDLAWRLLGFGRSSLPYLAANFLAFDALSEIEPERVVAHVATRHCISCSRSQA